MAVKKIIFYLIFLTCLIRKSVQIEENPYSFYLFENNEGCVKTFNAELKAIQDLKVYKDILLKYRDQLITAKKNWHHSKSLLNPIDSYKRLLKNFHVNNLLLKNHLIQIKEFSGQR